MLKSDNLAPNVAPTQQQKPQLETLEPQLLADIPPGDGRDPLRTRFERAYQTDKTPTSILQALECGDKHNTKITLADYENQGGILFYRNRFYVPRHENLRLYLM